MRIRTALGAGALALMLAACGPSEVESTANQAVGTVTALVPAGAEETVAAALADPTVEALAGTAEALLADPELQSALDQAFTGMDDRVMVTEGEALALDALSSIQDVTNYKMTVVQAPAGAGVTAGTVIKEASNGNISLNPDEYGKYFTTAGDYRIRLDVTTTGNKTASHEFTVTVP